jgi:hypothetical protein
MTDTPTQPDAAEAALDLMADDDLLVAEVILLKMGDRLPDPTKPTSERERYTSLMGVRARSLYENFLYSIGSPVEIGPILALRPLVETAILIKWISLDPTLNGQLWFAHAESRDLTAMSEQEKHLGPHVHVSIPDDVITEAKEEKQAFVDAAFAATAAAGKSYGKDRPLPHISRMVEDIERADPGHKQAMRQAYDAVYRAISPWDHSEASSFKATAIVTPSGVDFVGDRSPFVVEHLRIIAAAMFAYILEVHGVEPEVGDAITPRIIRDYLTIYRSLAPTTTEVAGRAPSGAG